MNQKESIMRPIFIIGMPRSGTKLLRDILNRHPLVSIPKAETEFIPYFYNNRKSFGDLKQKKNFHAFFEEFKKTSFFYYIQDADKIWKENDLYDRITTYAIEEVFEQILNSHAEYERKKIWGDKSPGYIYHTRLIKKLFPDSIFIHIIRDVRDYCLSVRKAWNKNIYRAAQKWSDGIDQFLNDARPYNKSHYFELKYEDLIINPELEIKAICSWIGIDFHKDMLNLEDPVENLGSAKGKLEILADNYGKWKNELTAKEIEKIERIAGDTAEKFGYVLTTHSDMHRLEKREQIIYYVEDIFNLFIYRAKFLKSKRAAVLWMMNDLKKKI